MYRRRKRIRALQLKTGIILSSIGLEDFGLSYAGSTLVFLSKTALRHYYKIISPEKFDLVKDRIFFGSDQPAAYTVRGEEIYFEFKNIAAPNLDAPVLLRIGNAEYRYSPLDYLRACLVSEETSPGMKALAKATFLYNQAANAFLVTR